jgi:raffinose/stachyose/melibiose transport system substrate-binding protein
MISICAIKAWSGQSCISRKEETEMKKTIRLIVSLIVIAASLLLATGCSGTSQSNGPVKLTVWVNGRDSFIGPSEQKLAQDQWYISQAFKRFEAANPGVTVELVVQSDALQAHQTFRTAGLAGNAPDSANLWAGQFIFALRDVTQDITQYIPKEDLEQINGWDTVTLDFKSGSPIIGYPVPNNQVCFFLYNKKIIKDSGLDFEKNPPRTMEDFMAALETIKSKGYQPMAADEGQGYTYNFFYIASYWWVQQNGLDPILAEDAGKAKFADDQALLTALHAYQDLYTKGYLNPDAATSADSWNKFLAGEVALIPNGSFGVKDAQDALGAENVGAILPPNISSDAKIKDSLIGGPGQSMVVSKNSKNPAMTAKLLSFLNSKAEVLKLSEFQTIVPIRKDISAEELKLQPGTIAAQMFEWSKNYVFWVDNSLSPAVVDDFNKLLPLVLTGKMTPEDFAAQLDKDKVQP